MKFFRDCDLSQKAAELVRFDQDSIRQVAAAERSAVPETWVADPIEYEKNGRVLRDSGLPRMLAYSASDRTLYATDGCNSCARRLAAPIAAFSEVELAEFAANNELPLDLLKYLIATL
jgi:hypothetical protein